MLKKQPTSLHPYLGLKSPVFTFNAQRSIGHLSAASPQRAPTKDNLSDAWVGTVIGILGSQLQLPWLVPIAAVLVGLLICKTAWDIFRESSHYLSDGFNEQLLDQYKDTALTVPGIKGIREDVQETMAITL